MWPGHDLEVRRVLVVRLDNIGDLVMLGPSLRVLRRSLPETHITLLASRAGRQIAPLLPWIDEVWEHRAVWQDASNAMPLDPAREFAFVAHLRERQFDAALIFTSFSQSPHPPAFACYQAGIPIRVGQSKEFGGSLLSQWVRPLPDETHQVDRNLHLLRAAGFSFDDEVEKRLELHVPPAVEASAERRLRDAGVAPSLPFLVVAPGASCPSRSYDGRFLGIAVRRAAEWLKLPVVLVGSSREEKLAGEILEAARPLPIASLVGKTSVPELCDVLRRCSLLLASHSGPMHIADAFRRPMVILFSGTDLESQWRPRNAPAVLLRRPTSCAPCYRFNCPYDMECLDLPPEEIADRAVEVYQRGDESSRKERNHAGP